MSDVAPRLATALADRYRIERPLGQGGMATVYLAADLKHDRKVAIKVLKPELAAVLGAERFVQEIKTTAALSHPHILPLFDSGEAGGFLFYVMPYIAGETIRDRLNRETQLGVDEALRITTEVADALDYAHRNGVIHRDIKPENLLLHDGRAMVMDFGIALAVSAAAGGRMTETGLSLGTPHYMSPEQATAEKEITARSDVYSLASVCYEMLAGEPPHTGGSAQQIIMKIIAEQAQPVTELRKSVPPHVAAALGKALEKLPADRFASAKEFAAALTDRSFGGATAFGTSALAVTRGPSRPALLAAAVAVLLVGAAAGLALKPSARTAADVVRFRVPTPEGTQLNVLGVVGNAFAISPDGKWLALVGRPARGDATQIYLRRIDQLEETLVAGSLGGDSPFFSPDSRELGFIASDGRLRRIAVAGGAVATITSRPADPRSPPAWADDGQIYFRSPDWQMFSVSESGGEPRPLVDQPLTLSTTTTGTALPSALSFPVALPGGKHILLSECVAGILRGNGNCNGRLILMDVATRERTTLDVPASRGFYMPGYLVLLDETGQVSVVEFDVERGRVLGTPVALLDGLGDAILQRAQIAVSHSGTLVFLDGEEVADRVLVEVDRRGVERIVIGKPGKYLWPRLSPDGTRILMLEGGVRSGAQIALYDKRLGSVTPLTFEGANQRASWSPDGRRIAFSSTRDSLTDVWIVPSDGSAPPRPINRRKDVQQHTTTSWTPDGRWIIIDGSADDGPNAGADDLYALAVDGDSALRPLVATPANEQSGEVSPNGRYLAYVSDDVGQPQVYLQYYGRAGGRWVVSDGAAIEPVWTSSNELIYTSLASDSIVAAEVAENVGVTRRALFPRSRYSPGSTSWREFDVSRDGKTFIFTRGVERTRQREPVVVVNWIQEVRDAFATRRGAP